MEINDKASWTKVVKQGKFVELTTLTGKIVDINGNMATIRKDVGSNLVIIALTDLTPIGEKSEVDRYVDSVLKSYNE